MVLPLLFRATLVVWISHVVLSLRALFTILTVITFTIILFLRVKILLWWRNKCLLRLQNLLFLRINFNWSFWDTPAKEIINLFMNRFSEVFVWLFLKLTFPCITCKTLFDWTWFWLLGFSISVASLFYILPWCSCFINFLHNNAWRFQTLLIKFFLSRAWSFL
jgi:hypothetical protein